jgi:hypothetical protein
MKIIQRIYLYLVSAISLTAITWALILLARLILSEGIGQGQITELASLLAVIIVGLPIFLFHWLIAQRMAARNPADRASIIRHVFLWLMMGIGAVPVIANVYRLLDNLLLSGLGSQHVNYYPYDLTIPEHLAAIIIWGIIWFYLWRQVQTDDRLIPPNADRLGLRRIYLLVFAETGLVMTTLGAITLLQTLMQTAATGINWRTPVADSSAQLLVGCVVWVGHWVFLQKFFHTGSPTEERSVLRKIYLYLNIFIFAVMTVFSASTLLKRLIELALGAPPADEPLLSQLSMPIPLLIIGGVFWAYHWAVLRQDAAQAPEAPRQATVRRIYAYLVAGVGLAVLLSGIVGLIAIVLDMLTSPAAIGLAYYREEVATFVAMIIAGAPVWLLPWRRSQHLALAATDTAAADERRSTTRKIYLYFYVLVAMLAIFGSAGWFVYHILTALLGADLPDDFITQVLVALVITLLAVGVGIYHWLAIRQDGKLEQVDEAQRLAGISVTVIDGDNGQLGLVIIQKLQQELPGIHIKPVGLTENAVAAMSGQPFTTAAVTKTDYIIGNWQALTAPEIASAVEGSNALKLVIPTTQPGWIWTGLRKQSPTYYAAQAARGIKQAIEGEEIDFDSFSNPALIVLAVIGGIIGFMVVAGGIIGIIGNL